MSTTNPTLLERIRDGADNDSWSEFFAIYEPMLVGYVRRVSRDRSLGWSDHDVNEAVQDVFIKLYRTMPKFQLDHARGRFRTWLWQITTNAILDRIPGRKAFRRAQQRGGDEPRPPRPKLLDEEQVDLRTLTKPGADEDEQWRQGYRQAILAHVLPLVREEISATNRNKWLSFEKHVLEGRPAADVAAELGINANLVYQNAARVMKTVRAKCLENYEEDVCDEPLLLS